MLWLFDTCGLFVGPAILLAGLVGLSLCLRASLRPSARRRLAAIIAAASPAAVGVLGAGFGLIVWWSTGAQGEPWAALGKVCLAGLAVAVVPAFWASFLPRHERTPTLTVG